MMRSYAIQFLVFLIIGIMSVFTFILFGVDKYRAVRRLWRIPEAMLILISFLFGGIGGWLGMIVYRHKTRKWKFRILVPLSAVLQMLIIAVLLWTMDIYHKDQTAVEAMASDAAVTVTERSDGWLFDGPSEKSALIFYPGAKVEAAAYAPMMHALAQTGAADVYIVKMPLDLAIFGMNKAGAIISQTAYSRYYIGGHSLGGVMAASYAADHADVLDGVMLLAAYPVKKLDEKLDVLLIYGSEDHILNMDSVAGAKALVNGECIDYRIEGGNHAQFGSYGIQKGDGTAQISAEAQQKETVRQICVMLKTD